MNATTTTIPKGPTNLQLAMIMLAYGVVLMSTVLGVHYGIVDHDLGSIIIGGILVHFGQTSPKQLPTVETVIS